MKRLADIADDFPSHSFVRVLEGDKDGAGHKLATECRRLLARGDVVLVKNFGHSIAAPFTLDFLSDERGLEVRHQQYDIHGTYDLVAHTTGTHLH